MSLGGGLAGSRWQSTVGPGLGSCSEYRCRTEDSHFPGEGTLIICGRG